MDHINKHHIEYNYPPERLDHLAKKKYLKKLIEPMNLEYA